MVKRRWIYSGTSIHDELEKYKQEGLDESGQRDERITGTRHRDNETIQQQEAMNLM